MSGGGGGGGPVQGVGPSMGMCTRRSYVYAAAAELTRMLVLFIISHR